MTTSPVVSITDELIAELELDVQVSTEMRMPAVMVDPGHLAALLAERADLKQQLAAASVDAERYQKLRTVTPYRFRKIQDGALTDGGDCLYFHSDRFDAAIDAARDIAGSD